MAQAKTKFAVVHAPESGIKNIKMGVNDHTTSGHGIDEMQRKIKLMSDAGMGIIREGFSSVIIGDGSSDYKFNSTAASCASLIKENGETLIVALSTGKNPPKTEQDYAEWEKYVSAVANQLKGQNVIFEVWNEYNSTGFNYNNATAEDYVKLLKSTYKIIKGNSSDTMGIIPNAEICGFSAASITEGDRKQGVGGQTALEWIEDVLKAMKADGGTYMTTASIHPYNSYGMPEDLTSEKGSMIEAVRQLLDKYGYNDIKITASEMGWSTGYPHIDDETQAKYIVRCAALRHNDLKNIIWYVSQEKQLEDEKENGYGLIRPWTQEWSGEYPPYMAKPALLSAANYSAFTVGAKAQEKIDTPAGIYQYKYKDRYDRDLYMAWTTNSAATISIPCEKKFVTVFDMYGNLISAANTGAETKINLTDKPVYILMNDKPIMVEMDYNTGTAVIRGNIREANKKIGVTVEKVNHDDLAYGSVVYIGQTTSDSLGNYSIISKIKEEGSYTVRIGFADISDAMEEEMKWYFSMPRMEVTQNHIHITNLKDIKTGERIDVQLRGIRGITENKKSALFVAKYKNNTLISLERTDVPVGATSVSGSFTAGNLDNVDEIKVLFWDFQALGCLTGAYTIQ